ncbi:hypothetical protein LFM09_10390 [Lentzea alba]|uniref:hypothetical protein n=1 Tax=Lentzea alba TaxID=2714351 RepID=UPI0039BFF858
MRKLVSRLLVGLALTAGSVALAVPASAEEWNDVGTFRRLVAVSQQAEFVWDNNPSRQGRRL